MAEKVLVAVLIAGAAFALHFGASGNLVSCIVALVMVIAGLGIYWSYKMWLIRREEGRQKLRSILERSERDCAAFRMQLSREELFRAYVKWQNGNR